MAKYIYILRLNQKFRSNENWTKKTFQIVTEHFNYLSKLKDEEIVVLVGKTDYENNDDSNFGLVIFEAESIKKATSIMDNDPAILNKVMYGEVHPFGIALK